MTTPLTLEQRILIAAEYNADRVEVIKELMEDNAIAFAEWVSNHRLDFQTASNGCFIGLNMVKVTAKELYELYLQQKK